MTAIAPMQMRRLMKTTAESAATRTGHYAQFKYPHSHAGTNPAFNNMPVEERELGEIKPGAEAPLAHRNVRKFPDWYKPYTFNYTSEGYLLLGYFTMFLFGYSYLNDICEQKGRRSRKVFKSECKTNTEILK